MKRAEPGDVIVIGCGNDLRGDDAAGRHVAAAVAARGLAHVEVRSLTQLVPELAVDLARHRLAIFVDATATDDDVRVTEVEPAAPGWRWSHHCSPGLLLAMAAALGQAPRAVVVPVPARDLSLGTSLSPLTARAVREAVGLVVSLCEAHGHASSVVDVAAAGGAG